MPPKRRSARQSAVTPKVNNVELENEEVASTIKARVDYTPGKHKTSPTEKESSPKRTKNTASKIPRRISNISQSIESEIEETTPTVDIIGDYAITMRKECEETVSLLPHLQSAGEVQLRLRVLEDRMAKLNGELKEAMDDNDTQYERSCRSAVVMIEPFYEHTKKLINSRLSDITEQNEMSMHSASSRHSIASPNLVQTVKVEFDSMNLKPFELEGFNGDFTKWVSFRDQFISRVHSNEKINPVDKLYRLKSLVSGQAATVLGNWQVTNQGYTAAWKKLCSVYDNDYLIARAHIREIFDVPLVTENKDNKGDSLRQLLDTTTNALRQLQGMSVNLVELMTMYVIESKLDTETIGEWEMTRHTKNVPSLEEFNEYLEKRSRALTNIQGRASGFKMITTNHSEGRAKTYQRNSRNDEKPREASIAQRQYRPCRLCQQDHGLFKCPIFLNKSLQGRVDTVKEFKLCGNCLGGSHELRFCRLNRNPCRRCPTEYHNSTLCPKLHVPRPPATVTTATITTQELNSEQ